MKVPTVEATRGIELVRGAEFAEFFTLSPFVWRAESGYGMFLRIVNPAVRPADKISRVHYARSDDGLHFRMSEAPALAPGPDAEDRDGCEDPTLVVADGRWNVYYSGWNEEHKVGNLMQARGDGPDDLRKVGVSVASAPAAMNPKEASVVRGADDAWNLFFEYGRDGASRIGLAKSRSAHGPWDVVDDAIVPQRPGMWDRWHLSPGPVSLRDPHNPLMFYNGADEQGRWRIGWIRFDPTYARVTSRCAEPLIVPPPPQNDDTDIAFCASLVELEDTSALYYSASDKTMLRADLAWKSEDLPETAK